MCSARSIISPGSLMGGMSSKYSAALRSAKTTRQLFPTVKSMRIGAEPTPLEAIGREYLKHEAKREIPSARHYRWTLERWIPPEQAWLMATLLGASVAG